MSIKLSIYLLKLLPWRYDELIVQLYNCGSLTNLDETDVSIDNVSQFRVRPTSSRTFNFQKNKLICRVIMTRRMQC